jgi:hypothetical protein
MTFFNSLLNSEKTESATAAAGNVSRFRLIAIST